MPLLIGNVYANSCPPGNCAVDVNSNVPSTDGTIYAELDNSSSNIVALPHTFSLAYNTTHTITVLNTTSFTGASTGGHYAWKEWAIYYGTTSPGTTLWTTGFTARICPANTCTPNGDIFNYTGSAALTAIFDKQYPTTLSFTDAIGSPLTTAPNNVTLRSQTTGATTTITSYNNQYITADKYSVAGAFWEGFRSSTGSQSIDLTSGPKTATISINAYPATIQVVDNNNNAVQGANVTITYINGTIRSYLSNGKGLVSLGDIPLGSFGLTVHYQNQAYGPYAPNIVGSPTYTVQVNGGSTPTTTTTAIVLLAIFGIAFFLILLAIKVRRPATPPRI